MLNTKGIEINAPNINNNAIFGLGKIWYFEIKINREIAKITGIEDGLDTNIKKIIKKEQNN